MPPNPVAVGPFQPVMLPMIVPAMAVEAAVVVSMVRSAGIAAPALPAAVFVLQLLTWFPFAWAADRVASAGAVVGLEAVVVVVEGLALWLYVLWRGAGTDAERAPAWTLTRALQASCAGNVASVIAGFVFFFFLLAVFKGL